MAPPHDDSGSPLLDFDPASSEFELTDIGACSFLEEETGGVTLVPPRSLTEQLELICNVSGAFEAEDTCVDDTAASSPCVPSPSRGAVPVTRPASSLGALDVARKRKQTPGGGRSGPGVRLVELSGPRPRVRAPLPIPGRGRSGSVATAGVAPQAGPAAPDHDPPPRTPPEITGVEPLPAPMTRSALDSRPATSVARRLSPAPTEPARAAVPKTESPPARDSAEQAADTGSGGQDRFSRALDEFTGRGDFGAEPGPAHDLARAFGGYFDPAERAAELERIERERTASRSGALDRKGESFGWDVDEIDEHGPAVPRFGIVRRRVSKGGQGGLPVASRRFTPVPDEEPPADD